MLTALQVKYGATHSEAIMVDGEPCLVETGARMHGMRGPKMTELATGLGTCELVVDVYAHRGRLFSELIARDFRYFIKKATTFTFLNNTRKQGILAKDIDLSTLGKLPSVVESRATVRKGQRLVVTRDVATMPGYVYHVHPRLEQCIADSQVIRELEAADGFYEVVAELDSGVDGNPSLDYLSTGAPPTAALGGSPVARSGDEEAAKPSVAPERFTA